MACRKPSAVRGTRGHTCTCRSYEEALYTLDRHSRTRRSSYRFKNLNKTVRGRLFWLLRSCGRARRSSKQSGTGTMGSPGPPETEGSAETHVQVQSTHNVALQGQCKRQSSNCSEVAAQSPQHIAPSRRHWLAKVLKFLLIAWFAALALSVVGAGAIFVFVFMGWAKTPEDDKAYWMECCSQVINGVFTYSALHVTPHRTYLLWKALRGDLRPLEQQWPFLHPMAPGSTHRRKAWALVVLFNMNCWCQYPITAAMWAWALDYTHRPVAMIAAFLPLCLGGGAVAGFLLLRWTLQATWTIVSAQLQRAMLAELQPPEVEEDLPAQKNHHHLHHRHPLPASLGTKYKVDSASSMDAVLAQSSCSMAAAGMGSDAGSGSVGGSVGSNGWKGKLNLPLPPLTVHADQAGCSTKAVDDDEALAAAEEGREAALQSADALPVVVLGRGDKMGLYFKVVIGRVVPWPHLNPSFKVDFAPGEGEIRGAGKIHKWLGPKRLRIHNGTSDLPPAAAASRARIVPTICVVPASSESEDLDAEGGCKAAASSVDGCVAC